MKSDVHPKWFEEAKITCACGNTFLVGATMESLNVEVCYNCHPFYTGQMKYLDTAGRVDAFKARQAAATDTKVSKAEKRKLKKQRKIQEELDRPDSLVELRKQLRTKKKDKN